MSRFGVMPCRRAARLGALLAAGALWAPSVAAQQAPSVLSLLPVSGDRTLQRGAEREASLTAAGVHHLPGGRPVVAWAYTGRSGESVTIDVAAESFDAMLYVVAPNGHTIWDDDDSGGGCNARVELVLPAAGRYLVVASALDGSATGDYRVQVREGSGHAPTAEAQCGGTSPDQPDDWEIPAAVGEIGLGETKQGTLAEGSATAPDGSWVHVYTLRGVGAGETVYVHLKSDAFDAFLRARTPGLTGVSDDDSGGGCNALLEWTLPAEGPYSVVVSTLSPGETGAYELAVTRTRPEVAADGCDGGGSPPVWDAAPTGSLAVGESRTGELSLTPGADRSYQVWEVRGGAGESVTVDLRSDAFDAYLVLLDDQGGAVSNDDDGGGRCDARLTFLIPSSGVARVAANSLDPTGVGAFTLVASRVAPPVRTGECGAG